MYQDRINQSKSWLRDKVFPLWSTKGVDPTNGGFVENLSHNGEVSETTRRVMVQARQIYSFAEGARLNVIDLAKAKSILSSATKFLLNSYFLPTGAVRHSVDVQGKPAVDKCDLYGQGFAIFGLAHAYDVLRDPTLKEKAQQVLNYLNRERRVASGGFVEVADKNGVGEPGLFYQANPHMHLFEASIAWMKIDNSPQWKEFAGSIFEFCRTKFIDEKTGALCEHFDENWHPQRQNGQFIFEPGHHYEWAWLMLQYEAAGGTPVGKLPLNLFLLSEEHGVDPNSGMALDEIWSNGDANKRTSRFWPQCERIKAAVTLGGKAWDRDQSAFAHAADQGMDALSKFLNTKTPGLWEDTLAEDGQFLPIPAKASSLYHIINALSEYATKRPLL